MLKRSLVVTFFISFSCYSEANAGKERSLAPEASPDEAELSFGDITYLDKAFIDITPAKRKDGIVVGKLGLDGGNKDMINELAQEIASGEHGKFDSLLIAHKGKLIFESYYLRGRVNLPHFQASATKAYTGLALGRAIQLGYLTMADLDKPLISFLKGLDPEKFVQGVERITLNQALTMRGGLRISDDEWKKLGEKPATLKRRNFVQALFEHSAPISDDSQKFSYGNFNPNLVMHVIEALVPGTAEDFIRNELLNKMGISTYAWQTGIDGLPSAGSRSSMTSRAMLKFGILARNNGQWDGKQLISETFIKKAISKVVDTSDQKLHYGGKDVSNQGYGYYWWNADMQYNNKRYFSTSAQGGWGQMVIMIEELDLLVVTTAHDNDTNYLQITAERILPAFVTAE